MEIFLEKLCDLAEDAFPAPQNRGEPLVALLHALPAHLEWAGDKNGGMQVGADGHLAEERQDEIDFEAMNAGQRQDCQDKAIKEDDSGRRRRRHVSALIL